MIEIIGPLRKRTQSPSLGVSKRSSDAVGLDTSQGLCGIALGNPGRIERLTHAAWAITSARKAACLHLCIGPIIDKPVLRQLSNQSLHWRHAFLFPASFAYFPLQILRKLVSGRGVPTDIGQRELAQIRAIERFRCGESFHVLCPAQIVP